MTTAHAEPRSLPGTAPEAVIEAAWATRLPPQPDSAPGVLPAWAAPAVVAPAGARWPENRARYAVHIRDSTSAVGSYGPCSATVIQILRDQIVPGLIGARTAAWGDLDRLTPRGRHLTGPHVRMAWSAVDMACWDLRSRASGVPVAALLGGAACTSVRGYAGCLGINIDHSLAPDVARWAAETGFWAQKWRLPGWSRDEEPAVDTARMARLRDAAGDTARIAVDGLRQWDTAYATRLMPALTALGIAWVEEPLRERAGAVTGAGIAVAGGEHVYDEAAQLDALTNGALQWWQPDLSWNGGLTVTHRLVRVAALRRIRCLPHGNALVAALHLAALEGPEVIPAVEYHLTVEPLRQTAAVDPLVPGAGMFDVHDGVGLGVIYEGGDGQGADGQLVLGGGGSHAP